MDLEPIWREADETRLQRLADAARGVNKYFMTKYGSIEVSVRGGALSCRLRLCVTNIGSCVFAPLPGCVCGMDHLWPCGCLAESRRVCGGHGASGGSIGAGPQHDPRVVGECQRR